MSHPVKYLPLALLVLTSACRKDDTGDSTTGPECEGAAANAGPDQTVALGPAVDLDGSGSSLCEDSTYYYVWKFDNVPVDSGVTDSLFTENNSDSPTTSFQPDVEGTYVVSLVLNDLDTAELTAPDLVIIEVTSDNMPPVADCGDDQQVSVGDRVALDGRGSYDPEGVQIEFQWALSTVPDESSLDTSDLYNAGGPEATVIPDVVGLYVVSLVVGDGVQWSDADYCTVEAVSDNLAPVADAGTGGTLPPCTDDEIILNGYGSYDPEGTPITYLWSLISAPKGSKTSDASFDDRTSPTAHFYWDVSGSYSFQLRVNDGESESAPDVVTYTVLDRSLNNPPISNAGDDQTISASADCDTSAYVWTCDDCPAAELELDGTASTDPDGDELHYVWTEDSGEIEFATPYAPYTVVETPPVPTTVDTTVTTQWEITLSVSDCLVSDDDEMIISYACTGTR